MKKINKLFLQTITLGTFFLFTTAMINEVIVSNNGKAENKNIIMEDDANYTLEELTNGSMYHINSPSISLELLYQSGSGLIYSVEPDDFSSGDAAYFRIKCHPDVSMVRIDWIYTGTPGNRYPKVYTEKSTDGYFYIRELIFEQFEIGVSLTTIPPTGSELPPITSNYETRGYKATRL